LGAKDPEMVNLSTFCLFQRIFRLLYFPFQCSSRRWVRWKLEWSLEYEKLLKSDDLLKVQIDNVGHVFFYFLSILTHILLVLHFPGSAEADVW